jgi:pimeloyl-ACP methyl ester carboxylesterase
MVTDHWARAAADGLMEGEPAVPYRPQTVVDVGRGVSLAFDEFGCEQHPPVLLVMGLGMQMLGWEEGFCARLAAGGYRVIRFDNRDVGASTRFRGHRVGALSLLKARVLGSPPASLPYLLPDMADDAVGLLDALGIERAHVFGCSMGGMIVQLVAAGYPDRVLSLTSMMSTSGSRKVEQPSAVFYARLLKSVPTDDLVRYQDGWIEKWRALSGPGHPIDEARLRMRCARSFDRGPSAGGIRRQAAAILSSGSRRHVLRKIRARTLIIHGSADPLVPVAGGIDTADHIEGARLVIIQGMGHSFPPTTWPKILDSFHVMGSGV